MPVPPSVLLYEESPAPSGDNNDWLNYIKIGQRFDLELLSQRKIRCSCELLGFRPGKYVLLRLDEDAIPDSQLLSGLPLICRFLVEDALGECFAFRSELLHIVRFPDKIIMVNFPPLVQRRALRNEKRNSIYLPARLRLSMEKLDKPVQVDGHLVDISANGCRFLFKTPYKPDLIRLATVLVHISHDIAELNAMLHGTIRNARIDEYGLTAGIQFATPEPALARLVNAELPQQGVER